jgi:signal transduction histidine kinase
MTRTGRSRLAAIAAALRARPAELHARSWFSLFVGARAAAALVAAGLLALQPLTESDPLLATVALLWGAATIVALRLWPSLMGRPAAWVLDLGVALLLVVLSGEWRSPFYLLAVSALIPPATTLPVAAAVAVGAGFAATYFALALTLGIDWDALGSTARLESFSTHLLIPLLVVVALAHGARLLNRLDSERERAAGLALEGERRRIAWELHDSAKQRIHAAQLVLSSLAPQLAAVDADRLELALAELDGSASDLEASLTELRTTLGGLPLDEAIARRAAELQAASGVEIHIHGHAPSLPTFVAVHAYRVACEAISNALRHAEPDRIDVTLVARRHELAVLVEDDGRGIPEPDANSTGLESMRARAQALGGRLLLDSRPRVGTRVELEVPLRGSAGGSAESLSASRPTISGSRRAAR